MTIVNISSIRYGEFSSLHCEGGLLMFLSQLDPPSSESSPFCGRIAPRSQTLQPLAEFQLRSQGKARMQENILSSYLYYQICDFGLARSARPHPDADDTSTFMTEYVATRLVILFMFSVCNFTTMSDGIALQKSCSLSKSTHEQSMFGVLDVFQRKCSADDRSSLAGTVRELRLTRTFGSLTIRNSYVRPSPAVTHP